MSIEELVIELSKDPFNPTLNFKVAVEYERMHQTASAVSFYLRTAEYGDGILAYNSLLKLARCFEDQNDRVSTVSNCILQAAALLPSRPEAYFMMSQFHERLGNWQECYTWACLGLDLKDPSAPLPADIGYYNRNVLDFEKAVSAWWIGRKDEGRSILTKLNTVEMPLAYSTSIKSNLELLNAAI
jgi:hypothetical protein